MRKTVCVMGAGASGLVALKECLEEGHDAHAYEAMSCIGGAFAGVGKSTANRLYENLHLTISNYYMAYSDFPPKCEWKFWTGAEYTEYLNDYAETFDLKRHITLSTRILRVERHAIEGQGWTVTMQNTMDGTISSKTFDAVAVSIGAHQRASFPTVEGMERFKGEVHHSSTYVDGQPFKGKRVVCIGMGESAADIVKDISDVSAACHLVLKTYPFCIPRMLPDGHPADALTGRLFYPNRSDGFFMWLLVLLYFWLIWMPLSWFRWSYPYMEWRGAHPADGTVHNSFDFPRRADARQFMDVDTLRTQEAAALLAKWHTHENSSWVNKFATKNVRWVPNVVNGKIQVTRGQVVSMTETGVVLQDGTEVPADVVMFCTGYRDEFPFLAPELAPSNNDVRSLYLHAFKPGLPPSICFIGFSRPTSGAVPGCSELVSRYFALLLSGKRTLPANIVELVADQTVRENKMFFNSPNVRSLVIPCDYMDEVALRIGCLQSPWAYWYHPLRFIMFLIGANCLGRFRLVGPHAKPEMARKWLDKLTMPLPHIAVAMFVFFKIGRSLGYGTGDFIADMRTIWGVEVTKVIGLGAAPATPEQLGQQPVTSE